VLGPQLVITCVSTLPVRAGCYHCLHSCNFGWWWCLLGGSGRVHGAGREGNWKTAADDVQKGVVMLLLLLFVVDAAGVEQAGLAMCSAGYEMPIVVAQCRPLQQAALTPVPLFCAVLCA